MSSTRENLYDTLPTRILDKYKNDDGSVTDVNLIEAAYELVWEIRGNMARVIDENEKLKRKLTECKHD